MINKDYTLAYRGKDSLGLVESGYLGPVIHVHDSNTGTVGLCL